MAAPPDAAASATPLAFGQRPFEAIDGVVEIARDLDDVGVAPVEAGARLPHTHLREQAWPVAREALVAPGMRELVAPPPAARNRAGQEPSPTMRFSRAHSA